MSGLRELFKKRRVKVLIVDDEDDVRTVLEAMLDGEFEVLSASNGEMAIDIAYKERPEVIILDYMMPGMNGGAVAAAIRRLAPGTRIIAFTAMLKTRPEWADLFIEKTQIGQLLPALRLEANRLAG